MVSTSSSLAKVMVLLDGLVRFAGQSEDEVAVDDEAELVAILGELPGTLDGCALLDVLQNLRVAGLVAHDQRRHPASFIAFSVS